jgi:hypothetical protein
VTNLGAPQRVTGGKAGSCVAHNPKPEIGRATPAIQAAGTRPLLAKRPLQEFLFFILLPRADDLVSIHTARIAAPDHNLKTGYGEDLR